MRALTRTELDQIGCENPDCDHREDPELFLHSVCHPNVPTWVSYDRLVGALTVRCADCERVVVVVAVQEVTDARGGRVH
jgi:hypothetical protein